MSNKLIRSALLIVVSNYAFTAFAQPLLPATPTSSALFPQIPTPQSRLPLKKLPELKQQAITSPMTPSTKVSAQTAQQQIYVSHISFVENTVFSDKKLAKIVGIQNRMATLGELDSALNRITALYHKKGYILARAYLPVQTIRNGNVTIRVREGIIANVVLENNSTVLTSSIRSILDSHYKIGKPLNNVESNRALMILKQMPGIGDATASLKPGSTPGTTIVTIKISHGQPVTGNIGANNYATRFSGKYQLNTAVNINNLTHHGDQIGLLGGISNNDYSDNARVFWEIPLTDGGLRSGVSLTRATYQVGDSLSSLGSHGNSNAATWYGRYPLYLSPLIQTNLDLSLDHRWLVNDMDSVGTSTPERIDAVVLTLGGNAADNFFHTDAVNAWSIANTLGTLSIDNASQLAINQATAKTNGEYDKMVFLLSRQQALTEQWSLYLSGNGQWSSKNLDSSEQFVLGGPTAVRAYPTGEAGGDEGLYGTIEARDQLRKWLQLTVFYDAGKIWFNKNPYIQQSNTRVIEGPGVGANISYKKFTLNTALAVRDTGPALSDYDQRPRWWLQLQYDF